MSKSAFQADLEEFTSFFGSQETLTQVANGTVQELQTLMEACPGGAAKVLAVGLQSANAIDKLARSEELSDLAEQAAGILKTLSSRSEDLEAWLTEKGMSMESLAGPAMLLALAPMFDIEAPDIMIRWQVRTLDGKSYESVTSAWTLLNLFPNLGEAVRKGWQGMKKIGWDLPDEQVTHYAEILKKCADTVEALSSLLPTETDSTAGGQSPQDA